MLRYTQFYHPRYWLTWLGLGLLYLIAQLPYRWQLSIGRLLGKIAYCALPRRRHIAAVNLRLCFPTLNEHQRQQLLKAHFAAIGIGIVETGMAWWMPTAKLPPLQIEGAEHLMHALTAGKGVILLSAHFTTLEIAARLIARHFPICVIYRLQKNRLFNLFMENGRRRNTSGIISSENMRGLMYHLKKNAPIYYAADQDHGLKHGIFIPFFGVPAATITTTSRLVKMSHAVVVPVFHYRLEGNQGYRIVFQPGLTDFPSADIAADTLRTNKIIEQAILVKPEQYYWVHRRFKTRPEGEEYPY